VFSVLKKEKEKNKKKEAGLRPHKITIVILFSVVPPPTVLSLAAPSPPCPAHVVCPYHISRHRRCCPRSVLSQATAKNPSSQELLYAATALASLPRPSLSRTASSFLCQAATVTTIATLPSRTRAQPVLCHLQSRCRLHHAQPDCTTFTVVLFPS
jgi:hypothetical protein